MMKYLLTLSTICLLQSCVKPIDERDIVPLPITAASTPRALAAGSDVIARLRTELPNSCHEFYGIRLAMPQPRTYEIRMEATRSRGRVCADVLQIVDTAYTLPVATSSGRYLLRYFYKDQLFKTDTVDVN